MSAKYHCLFMKDLYSITQIEYSETCHLRSLFWTATCLIRPLYEVNMLRNSIDLMFISPLFCLATCLLLPNFVENFSGRSKQVSLYILTTNCPGNKRARLKGALSRNIYCNAMVDLDYSVNSTFILLK